MENRQELLYILFLTLSNLYFFILGNVKVRDNVWMAIQLGLGSKDKEKRSRVSQFCIIYQIERGRNKTDKQASTERASTERASTERANTSI